MIRRGLMLVATLVHLWVFGFMMVSHIDTQVVNPSLTLQNQRNRAVIPIFGIASMLAMFWLLYKTIEFEEKKEKANDSTNSASKED